MFITYGLLGLSICALWLTHDPVEKIFRQPSWLILFMAAVISGTVVQYITVSGIVIIGIFLVVSHIAMHTKITSWQKTVFSLLTMIIAFVLSIHRLPGFHNPVLIANVRLAPNSAPYTQYLNFDKGMAGLILLLFCKRTSSLSGWQDVLRKILPIVSVTIICVIVAAMVMGYVKPDFKLSWYTPAFLIINLLFTCIAEEALFRGWLQEHLL